MLEQEPLPQLAATLEVWIAIVGVVAVAILIVVMSLIVDNWRGSPK